MRVRALLLAVLASLCWDFVLPSTAADCPADRKWLPKTEKPRDKDPNSPDVDCPFYQAAWQHFLYATRPDHHKNPAFFSYKTIDELFGATSAPLFAQRGSANVALAPRVAERPNETKNLTSAQRSVIGSDVFQAGQRGLLIDQRGAPVFYAIHVNDDFEHFLRKERLKTKSALCTASDSLEFPRGVVELKSAWQIVDPSSPPKNYIIATGKVHTLRLKDQRIVVDMDPKNDRSVTVALLALHVVFVLDGHPEFIWSTFEHVDSKGVPDLAPSATTNPTNPPSTGPVNDNSFTLYRAHTPAPMANVALITDQPISAPVTFDEATQIFKLSNDVAQTSVYRVFPGSKSNVNDIDDEVQSSNDSVGKLFGSNSTDRRSNYRLIGGIWLKHPKDPELGFKLNDKPTDAPGQSTDDPKSRLQGEDRLSGMAMESFTQTDFNNCFKCHNTQEVDDDDTGLQILPPKLLNVSHVLSKFLSSPGVCHKAPGGAK